MNRQLKINFSESGRREVTVPVGRRASATNRLYRLYDAPAPGSNRKTGWGSGEMIGSPGKPVRNRFIEKLTQIIEANLDNEFYDIHDLCRDACASRTKLHTSLKRFTGLSATKFIRAIRLRVAIRILLDSDQSITQVAYEVGFQDACYFSRVFSESFGISPSAFRQRGPNAEMNSLQ